MKILFLDESGDHNLTVIDGNYPLFVLGGVIVDKDYAIGPLTEAMDDFKGRVFGRTDIVLHTADIARNRNGFEALNNPQFREAFYEELNSLAGKLDYTVVACAIRKNDHFRHYGAAAIDLYRISLHKLSELFCDEIGEVRNGGMIVAESRDTTLDQDLEYTWSSLRRPGAGYSGAEMIRDRIRSLTLYAKKENIAGLQLADLVVSPIGRHLLGKPDKDDWLIVEQKLRRGPNGEVEGYGVVSLPK